MQDMIYNIDVDSVDRPVRLGEHIRADLTCTRQLASAEGFIKAVKDYLAERSSEAPTPTIAKALRFQAVYGGDIKHDVIRYFETVEQRHAFGAFCEHALLDASGDEAQENTTDAAEMAAQDVSSPVQTDGDDGAGNG